jgi:3-oxoacyl-[acyl-carrier-protein] synthase-1
MRRVVITGLGIVSCLGNNQEEVHQSLLNSKSGISYAEEYKEHNLKSHVHGKPNIKLEDHIDRKTIRFMGSGSAYNYIAMKEAIEDSGLEESEVSNFKTGIVMGSLDIFVSTSSCFKCLPAKGQSEAIYLLFLFFICLAVGLPTLFAKS